MTKLQLDSVRGKKAQNKTRNERGKLKTDTTDIKDY